MQRGQQYRTVVGVLVVVLVPSVLVSEQLLVVDLFSPFRIATSHNVGNRTTGYQTRYTRQYNASLAVVSSNFSADEPPTSSSASSPPVDEDPRMDGFHICRTERVHVLKVSNVSESLENGTLTVNYQCRGGAYDRFAEQMKDFVLQRHSSRNQSLWGRRNFPLPDNATVLVLGNSHTRQTMQSLFCQYSHLITRVHRFNFPDAPIDEVHFANRASVVLTSNSPLVYSKKWNELIRKYDPFHRSLSDYDAIVLGAFNQHRRGSPSNFHKHMLALQERYPNEVQYTTVPPPTLSSVARQFSKPIVALPMFAEYGLGWERSCNAARSKLTPSSRRSSVVVLHSRAHIEALHHECGSDGISDIGLCWNKGESSPYGRRPSDMHRCTGPRGGHPDLLAWDVVEALHRLLLPPGR